MEAHKVLALSRWNHELDHGFLWVEAENIQTFPSVDGLDAHITCECFVARHAANMLEINPAVPAISTFWSSSGQVGNNIMHHIERMCIPLRRSTEFDTFLRDLHQSHCLFKVLALHAMRKSCSGMCLREAED